jgi:hypothetical protein
MKRKDLMFNLPVHSILDSGLFGAKKQFAVQIQHLILHDSILNLRAQRITYLQCVGYQLIGQDLNPEISVGKIRIV